MFRHWRVRYNGRDDYVTTRDGEGSQLDQIIEWCHARKYPLADVFVIENATSFKYKSLLQIIKEAIASGSKW